jgi:hypothetical protein
LVLQDQQVPQAPLVLQVLQELTAQLVLQDQQVLQVLLVLLVQVLQ